MEKTMFKFNAEITYGISRNAEIAARFSAEPETRLVARNIRQYLLNENATAARYNEGMELNRLYQIADIADCAADLKAGEELFIIWSDRFVSTADNIEELNKIVVANRLGHSGHLYYKTCAFRIRRTPKEYRIFHLKPIDLIWCDDTEINYLQASWYKGIGWYTEYYDLVYSWEEAKKIWITHSGR